MPLWNYCIRRNRRSLRGILLYGSDGKIHIYFIRSIVVTPEEDFCCRLHRYGESISAKNHETQYCSGGARKSTVVYYSRVVRTMILQYGGIAKTSFSKVPMARVRGLQISISHAIYTRAAAKIQLVYRERDTLFDDRRPRTAVDFSEDRFFFFTLFSMRILSPIHMGSCCLRLVQHYITVNICSVKPILSCCI